MYSKLNECYVVLHEQRSDVTGNEGSKVNLGQWSPLMRLFATLGCLIIPRWPVLNVRPRHLCFNQHKVDFNSTNANIMTFHYSSESSVVSQAIFYLLDRINSTKQSLEISFCCQDYCTWSCYGLSFTLSFWPYHKHIHTWVF